MTMTPHDTDEQFDNSRPRASTGPGASAEAPTRLRSPIARAVVICVVVATVAILLRGLLTPATQPVVTSTSTPAPAAPQVGHLAPNLTLLDLRNQRVPLSSLRGKVVILNFWYAACEPCLLEMPTLEKAYRAQQGKGLVVVGINTSDDAQTIIDFARRIGITYPILRDVGQRAVVAYAVLDTPTSFILDRRGVIRYKYAGPLDRATLDQDIPPLLKELAP